MVRRMFADIDADVYLMCDGDITYDALQRTCTHRQAGQRKPGYGRWLPRRYVKSFPALSNGFEIETELTVHALELRMPISEIDTPYGALLEGSQSKLSTYRVGFRSLLMITKPFKNERPLFFFALIFGLLSSTSIGLSIALLFTYIETGLVPRFPTAILAASIMLLAFMSLTCGLILDTVTHGRREIKHLAYLTIPSVKALLGKKT